MTNGNFHFLDWQNGSFHSIVTFVEIYHELDKLFDSVRDRYRLHRGVRARTQRSTNLLSGRWLAVVLWSAILFLYAHLRRVAQVDRQEMAKLVAWPRTVQITAMPLVFVIY